MRAKEIVATFSIVGCDPETGETGIAVQSKFLAVGAVVPWAKAGVGAIATQAFANTSYGPEGLRLLAEGKSPEEAAKILTGMDEMKESRQFGIVDVKGNSATFTGQECYDWAGGIAGRNFTAQGNILVNEETVIAMAETFRQGEGPLAERLVKSLSAGQKAGGDSRGRQSAALLVVKDEGGYGGFNDRYIDLRVDDNPQPIEKLKRLLELFYLYNGESSSEQVKIEGELVKEIKGNLSLLGKYDGKLDIHFDDDLKEALDHYYHTENFEEREYKEGYIDKAIMDYMRHQVVEQGDK